MFYRVKPIVPSTNKRFLHNSLLATLSKAQKRRRAINAESASVCDIHDKSSENQDKQTDGHLHKTHVIGADRSKSNQSLNRNSTKRFHMDKDSYKQRECKSSSCDKNK